jgi:3-deoxy-D-manno-octulosonic-acid transferase
MIIPPHTLPPKKLEIPFKPFSMYCVKLCITYNRFDLQVQIRSFAQMLRKCLLLFNETLVWILTLHKATQ